jgi:hypothetical protein
MWNLVLSLSECERDKLHQEVKVLQVEEEARNKQEEKTQTLEAQLSSTQLLLDKENSKYQNACHQQEVSITAMNGVGYSWGEMSL